MTKSRLTNGNYAAIDIGSNAIRLLIKNISLNKDGLTRTKEQLIRYPLRLGSDVFTKAKISKKKAKDLSVLMKSFVQIMHLYEVLDYKACATSAFRDAENGKKIISLIRKKTGIKIHVLSGKEEAKLIYDTHSEFMQVRNGNFLFVDVGGGSTEVNLIVDNSLVFSNSYNIGTIRVLSNTVDPIEWEQLTNDLTVLSKSYSKIDILGTGGNINKLYRLISGRDKENQRITVDSLRNIYQRMIGLSLEERVNMYKLKHDRAEVIVPASHVFLTIADMINAEYIYVPTVGLADGIIDELVAKKIRRQKLTSNAMNPASSVSNDDVRLSGEDVEAMVSKVTTSLKESDEKESETSIRPKV